MSERPRPRNPGLRAALAALSLGAGAAVLPDSAVASKGSEPVPPGEEHQLNVGAEFDTYLKGVSIDKQPWLAWRFFTHSDPATRRMPSAPEGKLRSILASTPAEHIDDFWRALMAEPRLVGWIGQEGIRDAARRTEDSELIWRALHDEGIPPILNKGDARKPANRSEMLASALGPQALGSLIERTKPNYMETFWLAVRTGGIGKYIPSDYVRSALDRTPRGHHNDVTVFAALEKDKRTTWSKDISADDITRYLDKGHLSLGAQEALLRCLAAGIIKPDSSTSVDRFAGRYAPVAKAASIEKSYEENQAQLPEGAQEARLGMIEWRKKYFEGDPKKPRMDNLYLDLVRTVNHAHVFSKDERRELLAGMNAKDLYLAVTKGEAELYVLGTSAFRDQIAPTLLDAVRDQWNGDFKAFLTTADPSSASLAQFLRVAATFAKGDDFFGKDAANLSFFLRPVLQRIDTIQSGIHVATVLLDLLMPGTVARDPAFTRVLENILSEEFAKAEAGQRLVLGTIGALYAQYAPGDSRFAAMRAEFGEGATLESLSLDQLFTKDERGNLIHTARMYFFPGADGEASYAHFLGQFKSWQCRQDGGVTECTRTVGQKTVRILMNDPRSPDLKGSNARIDSMLSGKQVQMLIMRGHSGSVEAFIEAVRRQEYRPAVVHMGACGAFSHLASIFEALHQPAHVIATRGTGSMTVNDPVLSSFFESILTPSFSQNAPFRWDGFVQNIRPGFSSGEAKVREYFDAYQWPHTNYSAILLYRVSQAMKAAGESVDLEPRGEGMATQGD
jgi:hypothetical protein